MIKKIKYLSITLTLALFVLACQKINDDKVYPLIILEGNNPMKYIQGCGWVEPGFTAKDDKPGVQLYTTGLPNTNTAGEFNIVYFAVDQDSNRVTKERVVNIAPLDYLDVVGEYQTIDTIGPNEEIIKYQSKVSIFSQSPLLLKINTLNENYEAFLTFDSTGYLEVNYNISDTLIAGTGRFSCDKTFFNLSYYIDNSNVVEQHKATFTKK